MIKPFQIVWELIEFGLQALFVYGLAIILCIGMIAYVIADSRSTFEPKIQVQYVYPKTEAIEKEKECTRLAGCVIRKDGTLEW